MGNSSFAPTAMMMRVLLLSLAAAAASSDNVATPLTVRLEVPVGKESVTLRATEGDDIARLAGLFVEKYKTELEGTKITAAAVVDGFTKLFENSKQKQQEPSSASGSTDSPADENAETKYSAQLTVNLGSKGKVPILITEGDDVQELARAFCVKHGLGQAVFDKVVQSMQILLQEARTRGEAAAEMELVDTHYSNALGAFAAALVGLKLLQLAARALSGVYKRRQHKNSRPISLDEWAEMPKSIKTTKTGKNGNGISHRKPKPAAEPPSKSKLKS